MDISEYFILGIFLFVGLFSSMAALLNADWFFETRQAATFVNWLGRPGARIFYGLLGLGLIFCAVAGFLTWN